MINGKLNCILVGIVLFMLIIIAFINMDSANKSNQSKANREYRALTCQSSEFKIVIPTKKIDYKNFESADYIRISNFINELSENTERLNIEKRNEGGCVISDKYNGNTYTFVFNELAMNLYIDDILMCRHTYEEYPTAHCGKVKNVELIEQLEDLSYIILQETYFSEVNESSEHMKELHISAPNDTTIHAEVKRGDMIIHEETL